MDDNPYLRYKLFLVLFLFLFFVSWHPWITPEAVSQALREEGYRTPFTIILTDWSPFGHHYEAHFGSIILFSGHYSILGGVTVAQG